MIKVQTFVTNSHNTADHNKLSNGINKFLADNDVEVVDIKYSTCSCVDAMGKIHWIPTALMIYKDKQ